MDKRISFFLLVFFIVLTILLPLSNLTLKISLIAFISSLFLLKYFIEYLEDLELENNFPVFLRDLSQYIKIGQPLPTAIRAILSNNYGKKLNQYIRYLHLQLEYSIPFNKALMNLAKKIRVKNVRQSLIILANLLVRGGSMSELFESMSEMFFVSNNLKKERLYNTKYLALSYYGLFILVIFVIYAVYRFMGVVPSRSLSILNAYKEISSVFILVNAFFTGLTIGKVSEGKIFAGVIHSIILLLISILFILVF